MNKPGHMQPRCPYTAPPNSTGSKQCEFMYCHPGPHSFDISPKEKPPMPEQSTISPFRPLVYEGGRKDDNGKARYDLIPPKPLEELAMLYAQGAAKYGDRNWEKGLRFGRVFAALMRHAWSWWRGERNCPIDGQHHLASVVWCAFALMQLEQTHPELDDRPNLDEVIIQTPSAPGIRFNPREEGKL